MANKIKNWLFGSDTKKPLETQNNQPDKTNRNLSGYIAPVQLQRIRTDVQTYREAISESENVWFPHRVKMQKIFIDTINNGHVFACWERRKDLTLLRKWEFVTKDGKVDQATSDIFMETVNGKSQNKDWFNKFLNYSMDSLAYGYTLITLGDVIADAFPDLNIIRRWNVSPDRLNVTQFIYSISGAKFMEEPYKDWHVYIPTINEIGASKCGYGFLYKVALYEIFLRNLIGFNGDFVELFAQPYRVGKTTKTEDKERDAFEEALQMMGSAGYAVIDPEDEISFLESSLGGTGYQSYDNFETRLHKLISKIILGHADALDSIAGKLGNSNEKSPAEHALEDKQTKDGSFIGNIVNNELFVKMRTLGFNIPEEVRAVLKNDAEIMETNNTVIAQAVEMQKAGLVMERKYFTEQTGIPTEEPVAPIVPPINPSIPPKKAVEPTIKAKLEKIYNHNHKH